MKSSLNTALKYFLFFLGEVIAVALIVNIIEMATGNDWGGFGILLICVPFYTIARGVVSAFVFKTFLKSVIFFSTYSAVVVFCYCVFGHLAEYGIIAAVVVWVISFITTFIPWFAYDDYATAKKEKIVAFANEHPYIETAAELKLFEKARARIDDVDVDRQIEYSHVKEYIFNNLFQHNETDFRSACIAECKESLESLANKGVYYLMHFIALGSLSAKKGERVDFVGVELCHIQESKKLELLKCRINEQSYLQMEQELQELIEYYTVV